MANRIKVERNARILKLWDNGKGWKQKSIANHMRISEAAVRMVIWRARQRDNHNQ